MDDKNNFNLKEEILENNKNNFNFLNEEVLKEVKILNENLKTISQRLYSLEQIISLLTIQIGRIGKPNLPPLELSR